MAKGSQFAWDAQKEEAAALIATGTMSDQAIADQLRVNKNTIYAWKQIPEFKARVAEIVEDVRAHVLRHGIADVVVRVSRLNKRYDQVGKLIDMCEGSDVALIKEERELAKQAAQEVGQWIEKRDVTTKGEQINGIDELGRRAILVAAEQLQAE